jgi:hypothetical protein
MQSAAILLLGYYFSPRIVSHNDALGLASVVDNSTIDIAVDIGGTVNKYLATMGQ